MAIPTAGNILFDPQDHEVAACDLTSLERLKVPSELIGPDLDRSRQMQEGARTQPFDSSLNWMIAPFRLLLLEKLKSHESHKESQERKEQ